MNSFINLVGKGKKHIWMHLKYELNKIIFLVTKDTGKNRNRCQPVIICRGFSF